MDAFQPITLEDKRVIDTFLNQYPHNEGSECTFSNLFIWGKSEGIKYSIQDDCLLLHANDKSCMLMAFAEEDRLSRAIDLAVEAMRVRGEPFLMRSIPEWYKLRMEALFPGRFVFTREPHHDDYIYSAERLITLAGSKLHGKRNHINKFMSLYGDRYAYMPYDGVHFDACMALEEMWARAQAEGGTLSCVLEDEVESVRRALMGMDALGLRGGVLLVDGVVRAFTIGEKITDNMALIHVEKADASFQGAYAMINREFISHAFCGIEFVNREEDMGDEGLRRAKRSYSPVRMIEKYGAQLAE